MSPLIRSYVFLCDCACAATKTTPSIFSLFRPMNMTFVYPFSILLCTPSPWKDNPRRNLRNHACRLPLGHPKTPHPDRKTLDFSKFFNLAAFLLRWRQSVLSAPTSQGDLLSRWSEEPGLESFYGKDLRLGFSLERKTGSSPHRTRSPRSEARIAKPVGCGVSLPLGLLKSAIAQQKRGD